MSSPSWRRNLLWMYISGLFGTSQLALALHRWWPAGLSWTVILILGKFTVDYISGKKYVTETSYGGYGIPLYNCLFGYPPMQKSVL